ncbi:hypothetical protein F5Y09DRAFT_355554 [Xylaria sp. FL1042]|nr:hypothetical protein F5Y09DRAFT_355554 [Xylaria sp. FL1042]
MSIQKIAASVASLNQETNVGLVNFKALLGALFRQYLPSTPDLIKAYGIRASDIASDRNVNPKPSQKHGVFADHVGIDGTSIWAAATSGAESIAIHLLACMLARIWSRPEATAIWAELVSERKKELELTDVADSRYLLALNDSRIDITRDQLGQWDSSARAWLQSADEAMKVKQTQLMLIVNNVDLPVGTKPTLYQNVLQAWSSAILALNNLIQGVPQSVEYGSILLGISSWHIYPDMVVLENSPKPISQADPLVKDAGILTVGLNTQRPSENGISWSLPLGHLRYYGAVVKFIVDLWKFIGPVAEKHWLGYLAEAVRPLLVQESLDAQVGFRLMKLGSRRYPQFLGSENGEPITVPNLFGLDDINIFIKLLAQPEDSVQYLREIVKNPILGHLHNKLFIIRYHRDIDTPKLYTTFEYATALPVRREGYKRSHDGQEQIILNSARHCCWIAYGSEFAVTEKRLEYFRSQNEDSFAYSNDFIIKLSPGRIQWTGNRELFSDYGILHHVSEGGFNSNIIAFNRPYNSFGSGGIKFIDRRLGLRYINFEVVLGSMDNTALLHGSSAPLYRSLRALATASSIYNELPSSTISLNVISRCLPEMAWIPSTEASTGEYSGITQDMSSAPFKLNRSSTFSCLLLLETGNLSVPPTALPEVMAMAVGDSIYIAKKLISDPSKECFANEICQIKGSIGKSGVALMIPPKRPLTRQMDLSSWQCVNHNTFDGRLDGSFSSTTLHLGFTDYIFPVNIGDHGNRDFEVYFLESLVSVHDRGGGVADLDILRALEEYRAWTRLESFYWK